MTTAPYVPGPPPGPGVQPPFPAPPVEGRGRRVGLGLGIAAGVLVLICGGGGAALVGLGASMSGALGERAEVAVRGYLDAIKAQQYDRAYGLLCERAQDEETAAEFRTRVAAMPPLKSYTLGKFEIVQVVVPVEAVYADDTTAELDAYLGQDQDTGQFQVCELAE
jgi:hypothetical protein